MMQYMRQMAIAWWLADEVYNLRTPNHEMLISLAREELGWVPLEERKENARQAAIEEIKKVWP